jgi:hypothetical protein
MKDTYEVTKQVKVIGTLVEKDDKKFVVIEQKDAEPQFIDFDVLIDSIMGQRIKIETSLDID